MCMVNCVWVRVLISRSERVGERRHSMVDLAAFFVHVALDWRNTSTQRGETSSLRRRPTDWMSFDGFDR
jgi:hypothetical protein